ncbi:DUF5691 domain-containing protein, partial [Streptomyces hygroscopicus]|uniref:DUF5691 domain-containing protein n=1 Tax=Streptomyces hygroscopicus TaxID=1912 RepID=UPI004032A6B5
MRPSRLLAHHHLGPDTRLAHHDDSAGRHPLTSTTPVTSWDDLVAAALLGTERRTPPVAPLPGQDAPSALLDAAALSTVRRRAG